MGNVQMEAEQIRYKGSNGTYRNVQAGLDAAISGGGGSSTLAELTDTDISTPSNGQVLTYDSTAEKWENSTPATPSLSGLSDTAITEPSNGQVLTYDSTAEKWENSTPATPSLSGLSDTAITEPSNGQVLTYNGTSGKWENASGGGGGGDYTATAFEAKTPTGTNYEDYATITLPAGTYHVIAGVYSSSAVYPTTGVRIQKDGQVLCVSEASGIHKPCCMGIFYQEASTEYKVQIRGNSAGGATNGYYLVKKLADYTPVNNNR